MRRSLDSWLHRLNVDVGHAFAVLLLSYFVQQFYGLLMGTFVFAQSGAMGFGLLGPVGVVFGINVVAFLGAGVLGLGMLLHMNAARKCVIGLVWLGVLAFGGMVVAIPYLKGSVFGIDEASFTNPPTLLLVLASLLLVPVPWFLLAMLHSRKAHADFHVPS